MAIDQRGQTDVWSPTARTFASSIDLAVGNFDRIVIGGWALALSFLH